MAPAAGARPRSRSGSPRGGHRDEPYDDGGTDEFIDPRTLSIALADLLPSNVAVVVDSGHFTGWPSFFLDVADARSWIFVNAFQAVGLGLGNAIGAAVARPDRVTVAALGDGGTFLALQELETAARLGLRLLVVVYDDAAYGAEVHHFRTLGEDVAPAQFPAGRLVGPVVVIDKTAEVAADPGTLLTAADLDAHEAEHGPIAGGSWVLFRTGWAAWAHDEAAFLNAGSGGPVTPGPDVGAARWLAEHPGVVGFGVETVGIDAGAAGGFDPGFPVHNFLLGAGRYGLTQLANLDALPVTGALVVVAPLTRPSSSCASARRARPRSGAPSRREGTAQALRVRPR